MTIEYDPRTGLQVITKQPFEDVIYTHRFTGKLGSATISTVVGVTQENQSLITGSAALTLGVPTNNTTDVQTRISGGTTDEDYIITAQITDSAGNKWELDGLLQVRDRV